MNKIIFMEEADWVEVRIQRGGGAQNKHKVLMGQVSGGILEKIGGFFLPFCFI